MPEPTFSIYGLVFLASLIVSWGSVPFLRKIAFRLEMLDRPNQDHKTHTDPVPYLGGLALVIPILICTIFGGLIATSSEVFLRLIILIIPSFILAVVGFVDDKRNLPAQSRFVVQLGISTTVSLLLVLSGFSISITGNYYLDFLVSIFWITGIVNAFNFIDNLDGGAAGLTLIASITLFFLSFANNQYLISLFSLCLSASACGFLYWNINPARIYLGDGGALFIGTILSVLFLQLETKAQFATVSAAIPILVLALPIIDTSVVVSSRLLHGTSIFQGGRDHLSHRLQSRGLSRRMSAYTLWGLSTLFSLIALTLNFIEGYLQYYVAIFGFILIFFSYVTFLLLSPTAKNRN